MALPFSCAMGLSFGWFLLRDAYTGIVGCLPFLSFILSLVWVRFGLSVLGALGTFANTSKTSREASSTSITIYGTYSFATSLVSITSAGAKIMLSKNSHDVFGKFTNVGLAVKASNNSWFMCA